MSSIDLDIYLSFLFQFSNLNFTKLSFQYLSFLIQFSNLNFKKISFTFNSIFFVNCLILISQKLKKDYQYSNFLG